MDFKDTQLQKPRLHMNLPEDILLIIFSNLSPYPLLSAVTPVLKTENRRSKISRIENTLIKNTTSLSLLSCSLVCRKWSYPAIKKLWQNLLLSNDRNAIQILQSLSYQNAPLLHFKYSSYVNVLDTILSVVAGCPVSIELLTLIIKKIRNLRQLRICNLPNVPGDFFTLIQRVCPSLVYLDACKCVNLTSSHLEKFEKDMDIVGSSILCKARSIYVSTANGEHTTQDPLLSKPITRFLERKKTLIWSSEISHYGLQKQIITSKIIQRLGMLEEIHISLDHMHSPISTPISALFSFPDHLAVLILTYFHLI